MFNLYHQGKPLRNGCLIRYVTLHYSPVCVGFYSAYIDIQYSAQMRIGTFAESKPLPRTDLDSAGLPRAASSPLSPRSHRPALVSVVHSGSGKDGEWSAYWATPICCAACAHDPVIITLQQSMKRPTAPWLLRWPALRLIQRCPGKRWICLSAVPVYCRS